MHCLDGSLVIEGAGKKKSVDLRQLPLDARGYVVSAEATFAPATSPLNDNGQGVPYAVYGFGAHLAELEVDTELGTIKVLKITAGHYVGRAITPTLGEGQIEGGAAQGLGMALMEEFFPGKGENLHDYLIPTIGDMPPVESILIEDPSAAGPFGAKGVGEQALIPTAPAILNALYDAVGVRIRKLPATPDKVRAATRAKAAAGSGNSHASRFSSRHGSLRRLPASVLHPAGPRRGVRSLRERRRGVGARRSAHPARPRQIARHSPGAVPRTRRRLGWKNHEGSGDFRHCHRRRHHVSRLQARAVHRFERS